MQVLNSKRVSVTPDCSPPASSVGDSNDLATQQNSSTIGNNNKINFLDRKVYLCFI